MLILNHLTPSIQIQRNFDKGAEVLSPNFSDEFFSACGGAPNAMLSIQNGEGLEEEFTFEDRPYLLVGRSMMCDIRLNHNDVSYRHAYFQAWGGEIFFIDLASRAGTFQDSIARHSGFFRPGSSLDIGPYTIINRLFPSEAESTSSSAKEELPRLRQTIIAISKTQSKSGKKKNRLVRRPVTLIGNSPSCKIRLEDDSVSRVHCSLVLTNKGMWVVDLLGKDGITVNGERTQFALLNQGDELEIGKFHLVPCSDDVEALEDIEDSAEFAVEEEHEKSPVTEDRFYQSSKNQTNQKNTEFGNEGNDLRIERNSTEESVQLTVPNSPQQLNLSETFVLTLVEQFASMQQQILNQSNHHTMMMTQLFTTMHQTQQELIRDDLQRVHEISMELERLQHEMLKEKSVMLLTESRHIDEKKRVESYESHVSDENQAVKSAEINDHPEKKEEVAKDNSIKVETPPKTASAKDIAEDNAEDTEKKTTSFERTGSQNNEQTEDLESIRERRKEKVSGGVHSHAWLTQRMSDLEKEKSSHWQKIMNVLSRK